MSRITTLVLLALSFILLAAPLASLALPGAPLSGATLENSRGRNPKAEAKNTNCTDFNGYAPQCIGKMDGSPCNLCSATPKTQPKSLQMGGSPFPGLEYKAGTIATDCGDINDGKCAGQVCMSGTLSTQGCLDIQTIGAQP